MLDRLGAKVESTENHLSRIIYRKLDIAQLPLLINETQLGRLGEVILRIGVRTTTHYPSVYLKDDIQKELSCEKELATKIFDNLVRAEVIGLNSQKDKCFLNSEIKAELRIAQPQKLNNISQKLEGEA